MYRARAEAVSGIHVYADGKWLRCIGNKKVGVGDYIWTDGRCVYGNIRVSQQPIIVTAPEVDDDEGIPILVKNYIYEKKIDESENVPISVAVGIKFECYTFDKKGLKLIAQCEECLGEDEAPSIVHKNMINDKRGKLFFDSTLWHNYDDSKIKYVTLAKNIDKKGNVFEIRGEIDTAQQNKNEVPVVRIIKNGSIVHTADCDTQFDRIFNMVKRENMDLSGALFIFLATIEDENNWYFVSFTRVNTPYVFTTDDKVYGYGVGIAIHSPNGTEQVLRRFQIGNSAFIADTFLPNNNAFPIQDGYYFKIDKWLYPATNESTRAQISIYSPKGELLLQKNLSIDLYLMITSFNGKVLLGMCDDDTNKSALEEQNGLYLISNGTAERIISGTIGNWKLRPMKKCKNWHKRIKELTFE